MQIRSLFLLAILPMLALADVNALVGHEAGGNGDHLTAWFTARGYEMLDQFKVEERKDGKAVVEGFDTRRFEAVLNQTQLVLVNDSNRAMLKNHYGEVKD